MKTKSYTLTEDSQVSRVDRDQVIRMAIKSYGHTPGAWEYFNYLLSSKDPSQSNYFEPTEEYLNIPIMTKLVLAGFFIISLSSVFLLFDLMGVNSHGNGTGKLGTIGFMFFMFFGLIIFSKNRLRKEAKTRANLCRKCCYSLQGHQSIGTVIYGKYQLEVGPLRCPECGNKYPRIY